MLHRCTRSNVILIHDCRLVCDICAAVEIAAKLCTECTVFCCHVVFQRRFYGPRERWMFLSGLLRPSVWYAGYRAHGKGIPGNLEGEGRLLGGNCIRLFVSTLLCEDFRDVQIFLLKRAILLTVNWRQVSRYCHLTVIFKVYNSKQKQEKSNLLIDNFC